MIKKKYNNVADIMQYLKQQAQCTIRDLEYELSYSPNAICKIMKGMNYDLAHYDTVVRYFLERIGWTIDISEVEEMIHFALEGEAPFVVGVVDKETNEVVAYRYVIMKGIRKKEDLCKR